MPNMTDTGRTAALLNYILDGAGSAGTITQPYHLRLMTAMGTGSQINTNGSNGTELSGTGYTAGGSSLGASAPFGTFSTTAPSASNVNAVSWTAGASWATILGIEIWDTAATPLRWFLGTLSANITGVASGDTVQFAAASISLNATQW